MPRAFSSFNRSGSVPVSARTSALLPWSMCPAVPTTMDLIKLKGKRQKAKGSNAFHFVLHFYLLPFTFYLLTFVSACARDALVAGSASCPAWASPCSGADLVRLHAR